MTHPIDVVAVTSAIYSRKTRIGKEFCPNRPILLLPRIRGENLSHLQRPEWVVFPNIWAWVGWSVWFKTPFQKFTNYWFSVLLGPDSFDSTSFQISKLLCPPPECLVYGKLPVSKHPQQKAHEYIYISSQNARFIRSCPPRLEQTRLHTLTNSFAFFVKT